VAFDNLYQGHRTAVHPQAQFVKGDLAVKAQINAAIAAARAATSCSSPLTI